VTDDEGDGEAASRDAYDEWGNRVTGEIPGSTAHNLVKNGTFELNPLTAGNGWDGARQGSPDWLETAHEPQDYLGKRYTGMGGYLPESLVSDSVPAQVGELYVLSGWVCGNGDLRIKEYNSGC
jgi:hypothetical protein